MFWSCSVGFFFQAEDGIRDLVRSRGLGDVYKRQVHPLRAGVRRGRGRPHLGHRQPGHRLYHHRGAQPCLLYTSDAADERSSVDLGGRRIIKKKQELQQEADTPEKKDEEDQTRGSIDKLE